MVGADASPSADEMEAEELTGIGVVAGLNIWDTRRDSCEPLRESFDFVCSWGRCQLMLEAGRGGSISCVLGLRKVPVKDRRAFVARALNVPDLPMAWDEGTRYSRSPMSLLFRLTLTTSMTSESFPTSDSDLFGDSGSRGGRERC